MKITRIVPPLFLALIALPASAQPLVNSAALAPPTMGVETVKIDIPKPKPDRRIFWTGVSMLAASKTADAITTRRLLNDGGWENSAIYGRHPSPAAQSAVNAALFAGQIGIFYLTEHNRHAWIRWTGRTYMALQITNHAKLAVCNSGIDPHAFVAHNCYSWPI